MFGAVAMSSKTDKLDRRNIRSVELEARLNEMVDVGMEASGLTFRQIVTEALNRHLPNIIFETHEKRSKALTRFKALVPGFGTHSAPK